MVISFLVITVSIVVLLFYIFFYKDRFVVRRNTIIDLPASVIAQDLNDLSNWPHWVPWLIYDTNAKIHFGYSSVGNNAVLPSCLEWQGKLIKEGYISIIPARSSAHYCHTIVEADAFYPGELHFNIDLGQQGSHTLVSMQITSKVPFLQRWKSALYLTRAARDLELALIRLNAHLAKLNTASLHEYDDPHFELLSETKMEHFDAVTRPFVVSDQPMSQKMEQGFHDLMLSLGPDNMPANPSFAIYTKADLAQHYFTGKLGIPVQNLEPCSSRPERIVLEGKYLTLRYSGSYQNLSLAWHVAHSAMRLHHKRVDRKRPGVEIFETGPCDTPLPKDYITKIGLPIK
ncbi:AraC family transcriptional regulator [Marinomonas arenicola]|uniref:AraC family transcriptional regulator n=1 Tax=Marinomonas arenicola TaxID=569601 RepID=UPI00311E56B5